MNFTKLSFSTDFRAESFFYFVLASGLAARDLLLIRSGYGVFLFQSEWSRGGAGMTSRIVYRWSRLSAVPDSTIYQGNALSDGPYLAIYGWKGKADWPDWGSYL